MIEYGILLCALFIISCLFLVAAKGRISTYMTDTIKEYSPEQKIHRTK